MSVCSTSRAEGRTRAEEEEARDRQREAHRAKEGDRGFNREKRPVQGRGAYVEDSPLPAYMPAKPSTQGCMSGAGKKARMGKGAPWHRGMGRGGARVRVGGARL